MTLFLGLLFGSVGGVYLFLARREHSIEYLICGFVLVWIDGWRPLGPKRGRS